MNETVDRSKFEVTEFKEIEGPEKGLTFYTIRCGCQFLWRGGTVQDGTGYMDNNRLCAGAKGYWNTRESADAFLSQWQDEVKPIQPRHGDVFIGPFGGTRLVICDDGAVGGLAAVDDSGLKHWGKIDGYGVADIAKHLNFTYNPLYNVFD